MTGAVKKKGRLEFLEMKKNGEKAAWITAYDYLTAHFAEAAVLKEYEKP
jgi:3-methyl-2-oxobutanoate hydroxymethyltransferase